MEEQLLNYNQKLNSKQVHPDDASQPSKFQNKIRKRSLLFVAVITLLFLSFGLGYYSFYKRHNFNQQYEAKRIAPTQVLIQSSPSQFPTLAKIINPSVLPSPRVSTNIQAIDVTSIIKEVELSGNIINLTNDNYEQMSPKIYQNTIVWLDLSENSIPECQTGNIAHKPCISQIYMYDIKTQKTKKITSSQTWKYGLQLTDNYLLWQERNNQDEFENEKILLMNLKTKAVSKTFDKEIYYLPPLLIEKDRAIIKEKGAENKISIIDLNTGEKNTILEKPISNRSYRGIGSANISGDYIIWQEDYWKEGKSGSIVYGKRINEDVNNKQEIVKLSTADSYASAPQLYHNIVVWEKYEKPNLETKNQGSQYYSIYTYDINTGIRKKIISKKGGISKLKIYGEYILYSDNLYQSYKIYNLLSGEVQTIKIKTLGPAGRGGDLHNNRFVWVDSTGIPTTTGDIYFLEIE